MVLIGVQLLPVPVSPLPHRALPLLVPVSVFDDTLLLFAPVSPLLGVVFVPRPVDVCQRL